jgi:hypothetical protein
MNPIAYCAMASCSDEDWAVFGSIALIIIIGFVAINVILYLVDKFGKEKNMK